MDEIVRRGGCNCGRVRIEARGAPLRVGICHCLVCRKETGAPFNAFAVWRTGDVAVSGETRSWVSRTVRRYFCLECGSTVYATDTDPGEIDIHVGAFDDAPTDLSPTYELWVVRREKWQAPLPGAAQFRGDRV